MIVNEIFNEIINRHVRYNFLYTLKYSKATDVILKIRINLRSDTKYGKKSV